MFELTAKAVAEAALKAHAEGRLTAQNGMGCIYRAATPEGKECFCAVGAALPPAVLDKIANRGLSTQRVQVLAFKGVIKIPSDDEFNVIERIQDRHDRWAGGDAETEHSFLGVCNHVLAQ